MTISTRWQVANETAWRYEEILVPAILGPAAVALVAWSRVQVGEHVVDVGCGTGAAARAAAERVGMSGHVVGIDVNPGMIQVAKSLPAGYGGEIDWRVEDVNRLSLEDFSTDLVLCAQALQFFPNKGPALREMRRVLKHGGRVAISLWCTIQENPYFDALVNAVSRHVNPETAAGLGAAFTLIDPGEIRDLLLQAGFEKVEIAYQQLDLDLPPVGEFVSRHISATPMDAGFRGAPVQAQEAVLRDVSERLASFSNGSGMQVPFRTHLALAWR